MKIYITAANGMVGKNLIENDEIVKNEIMVTNRSQLNLLNYEDVKNYLSENKPEMVIHCAGKVGGIQANIKDSYGFFTENAIMGINLVKAAKDLGIKKIINLSSSCAYPRNFKNPLKEEYIMQGELEPTNEGYALAKLAVLKMCEYLSKECPEFQYKTLIPCNLYGRWDKFSPQNSHMIPAVIRKIHEAKLNNQKEIEIWGDGTARREFMYAEDLADCISKVINNFDKVPILMNVGLGFDYTINEYYDTVAKVIGWGGTFTHNLAKPVGMKQKLLDVARQTDFGWKAQSSLEKGILKTYEFYLKGEL